MKNLKQKDLKDMVRTGTVKNITNIENIQEFCKGKKVEKLGITTGIYGMNGGLFKIGDETCVIIGRSTNLFALI